MLLNETPVLGLTLLVTVATTIYDFFTGLELRRTFLFNPFSIYHKREYHRFLTHALIHADWFHLAFNMLALYSFGQMLEPVLGSFNFALLYLGALGISSLPDFVRFRNVPNYNALGASGAVSGVIFSFILFSPKSKILLLFIPMPAWLFAILFLVFSHIGAKRNWGNIGHTAHFWGAVGGVVITILLQPLVLQLFLRRLFF